MSWSLFQIVNEAQYANKLMIQGYNRSKNYTNDERLKKLYSELIAEKEQNIKELEEIIHRITEGDLKNEKF